MRLPAILLLFIGLSKAANHTYPLSTSTEFPVLGTINTNCSLEALPICGYRPFAGGRTVCTFLNMCFYDQFVLATQNEWRIESNEPCQWPTNDCDQILNERRHRTSLTSRKAKKHRRPGARKNASKSIQHSRAQKHHKTERRDGKVALKFQVSTRAPVTGTPRDQIDDSSETQQIAKVTSWRLVGMSPEPGKRRGRQSRSRGKKHRKAESKPKGKIQHKKETEIDIRETMFQ